MVREQGTTIPVVGWMLYLSGTLIEGQLMYERITSWESAIDERIGLRHRTSKSDPFLSEQ
jgi:hypothetical protein